VLTLHAYISPTKEPDFLGTGFILEARIYVNEVKVAEEEKI